MTPLHGAQTSITLHLLCGVADLNVMGSCAALRGQHTRLCVPAHTEGTDSALHKMLQDSAKWGCGKLATAFCLTTFFMYQ